MDRNEIVGAIETAIAELESSNTGTYGEYVFSAMVTLTRLLGRLEVAEVLDDRVEVIA